MGLALGWLLRERAEKRITPVPVAPAPPPTPPATPGSGETIPPPWDILQILRSTPIQVTSVNPFEKDKTVNAVLVRAEALETMLQKRMAAAEEADDQSTISTTVQEYRAMYLNIMARIEEFRSSGDSVIELEKVASRLQAAATPPAGSGTAGTGTVAVGATGGISPPAAPAAGT